MLKRTIHSNTEAVKKILEGINLTADAVKSTLGPKGQNVFIEEDEGRMVVTKDGVTVARNISFEDKLLDIGSQIVRDASERTNKEAGDGTTTAAVLTQFLATEGVRHKFMGFSGIEMQKGMDAALNEVEKNLKSLAKPIKTLEDMKAVALISCNNDEEIATITAETLFETGKDGVISIEKGDNMGITKEIVKGIQIENGYGHPIFINDFIQNRTIFEDPAILLIADDIQVPSEISPVLDKVIKTGKKQVVIICPEISNEVFGYLVRNKDKGALAPLFVQAPSYGDYMKREMEDLAIALNCKIIGKEYGVSMADISRLDSTDNIENYIGTCGKIISTMNNTVITEAPGDVKSHIELLKKQMEGMEDLFSKEKFKSRIGKLSGGIAVIKVGGDTIKEQKEKQYRVEDAVMATKAAIEEGIVAGGGVTLLNCYNTIKSRTMTSDFDAGFELVVKSLLQPIIHLAKSADLSHETIMEKISKEKVNFGYNFRTGEFGDMMEMKVFDPLKVARLSLRYAVSATKLFLSNDIIITINKEEKI